MTRLRIVSFDLSLRATGYCHIDGSTGVLVCRARGPERLAWIRDEVLGLVFEDKPHAVVIEGYSYASRGASVVDIGELGGVVRVALYEACLPVVEIPPACLKRFAVGKGNASKDDVLQAGVIRAGHTFADNNACDAWWLWNMALAHYEPDLAVRVPTANLEGLAKVAWPDLLPGPLSGSAGRATLGAMPAGPPQVRKVEKVD